MPPCEVCVSLCETQVKRLVPDALCGGYGRTVCKLPVGCELWLCVCCKWYCQWWHPMASYNSVEYGPGKTAALAGTSGCLVWFGTCVWLVVMPLSNCWQQRLQATLQHPTLINHFTDALPRPLQKSRSVCKRQCKLLGSVDPLGAVTGLFDRLSQALP